MDTAPKEPNQDLLPRQPLDLPKPPLDLPAEPMALPKEPAEIPVHAAESNKTYDPAFSTQVRTLLAWTAPGRPFRKRKKEFYTTSLLIMLLVQIILFLFGQYLLMLVVLSLVFASFALASVPPQNFHYKISTEGITIEDHFFLWQELYDFYFKKRESIDILHIRTKSLIPGELTLTLGDLTPDHVRSVLLSYLPFREFVKPTFMEKSAQWLARNFPLEKQPTNPS